MFHVHLGLAMGWIGVSLSAVATWIQYHRARRVSVDGISLTTWFQFVLMSVFWVSYGLVEHSVVIIAGSAIVAPMQIAIGSRLRPWEQMPTIWRAGAFIFSCCALPTLLFGWSAGVYGTGVAMVTNRMPQLVTLVRHPGDYGVSAGSWAVGAVCSLMWVFYYLGAHLWAAMFATGAAMLGNVAIAVLATWRHRQRAHESVGVSIAAA